MTGFFKCILISATFLSLVSCQSEEVAVIAEEVVPVSDDAPNIVVIMADDMGYSDAGFMGSGIHTPAIDSLAANGLLMSDFYNNARCCPSRASLLTGLYPQQTGLGDMLFDLDYPAYRGFLNDQCVTVAEVLGRSGYSTYLSGKWHIGNGPGKEPMDRGFDRFFGFLQGGVYYWPFVRPRKVYLDRNTIEIDKENFYSTEAISEYAVRFVKEHTENNSNPFFLYLPHIAPHFPLQAPEEVIAKYRGKYLGGFDSIRQKRYNSMLEKGIIDSSVALSQPDEKVRNWHELSPAQKDTLDLKMAVYAAQIEVMDRGIGQLVEQLKKSGELDNTLIFFFSDNGGSAADVVDDNTDSVPIGGRNSKSIYGPSWGNVSNTPYRMYKHWTQEGGIITPMVMHWPDKIKGGRLDHQRGHIMDLMPTILEVAGVDYPRTFGGNEILPCEGKSLMPIVRGEQRAPQEFIFWEHQGNAAVRYKNWKAVKQYPYKNWRLFDLSTDRVEARNLAQVELDTLYLLTKKYDEWVKKVGVKPWDELLANDRPKTNYQLRLEKEGL